MVDAGFLEKREYEEVADWIQFDSIANSYCGLARDIEKWEGRPVASEIIRSLRTPGASIRAKLVKTCKTHKPEGEITFRNIHGSSNYALAGLAHWVRKVLKEKLDEFPHLVRDSKEAVRKCMAVRTEPSDRICTADIREFFMSGTEEELIQDVTRWFSDPLKTLLQRALSLLLSSQYVESHHFPGRLWRVVLGSGMGLPHSGEVADLAFLSRAETRIVGVWQTMSVRRYLRFKDDIIMIGIAHDLQASS